MGRTIVASVGCLGGVNRAADVETIQELLNRVPSAAGGPWPLLEVTSVCGPRTVAAIQKFQAQQLGWDQTDGRVDPDGPTLQKLNELAGSGGRLQPKVLTTRTALRCPHGAPVRVTLNGPHFSGPEGAPALRTSDDFSVIGCPRLMMACDRVNWVLDSDALNESNMGVCVSSSSVPLGKVKIAVA